MGTAIRALWAQQATGTTAASQLITTQTAAIQALQIVATIQAFQTMATPLTPEQTLEEATVGMVVVMVGMVGTRSLTECNVVAVLCLTDCLLIGQAQMSLYGGIDLKAVSCVTCVTGS